MVDNQLERELSPPNGQLACPLPQFETNGSPGVFQRLTGRDGGAAMTSASASTTHQDAVVSPADGTSADVRGYKTLTLHITGTSSSRTVQFFGSVDGTSYSAIAGANLATFSIGTSTTGTDEMWNFDVSGLYYFRARVNAVSGGNVTVKSRMEI